VLDADMIHFRITSHYTLNILIADLLMLFADAVVTRGNFHITGQFHSPIIVTIQKYFMGQL
jgi:hypothetical protein